MYFRIIVKQNGSFLFRTSRISTPAALFPILRGIEVGFTTKTALGTTANDQTYTVEVLQAKSAEGAVMSFAEVAALEAGLGADEAVSINDPALAAHPAAQANASSWPTFTCNGPKAVDDIDLNASGIAGAL